jgi:hypothetical protein
MSDGYKPENWQSPIEGSLDRVTFEGGRLDEVVGRGFAHLEHMHGHHWFLLIGHDDGTETAIWFDSKSLKRPFYERRTARTGQGETR